MADNIPFTNIKIGETVSLIKDAQENFTSEPAMVSQFMNVVVEAVAELDDPEAPEVPIEGELDIYVAYQVEAPDVDAPFTPENRYYKVGKLDLASQVVQADTPIDLAGAETIGKHFTISSVGQRWVVVKLARTTGKFSVYLNKFSNQ